ETSDAANGPTPPTFRTRTAVAAAEITAESARPSTTGRSCRRASMTATSGTPNVGLRLVIATPRAASAGPARPGRGAADAGTAIVAVHCPRNRFQYPGRERSTIAARLKTAAADARRRQSLRVR